MFQKRRTRVRGEVDPPLLKSGFIATNLRGSDEYCPHCDNHFVIDAITPKPTLKIEGEDVRIDSRMLKDERLRQEQQRSIFDVKDAPNRLG